MCGIVGIVTRSGNVAPEILDAATQSLAHRGPDDSGTVIIPNDAGEIGLGNRRLAILDLTPLGHQPMRDPTTGNWIVYNGEIYNFREIREKLEREGTQFRSHSDTEVLLKAYGCWGEDCFSQLRGMFAFAIWDAHRCRLLLARDPMGIKPLYYGSFGQQFIFASEIRTLLGTGIVPRRMDHAGLLNYLTFGSLYDPITLIKGISNLRPGHYLIWEKGCTKEVKYWDLAAEENAAHLVSQYSSSERTRLQNELYEALHNTVRMQMVSDVPVGVFLSGGIDSSSLVAMLTHGGSKLSTFSIVFGEAEYNEAEYSRLVADKFGTDHHEILVSQQHALQSIPAAMAAMDLPTIDGINTYLVSEKTRAAGIKVALSGLGGDELFGGYSTFSTVQKMERFVHFWRHVPFRSALADAYALVAKDSDQTRKLMAVARANGGPFHPYFISRMLFTQETTASLLRLRDVQSFEDATASLIQNLDHARHLDAINRVSYLESRCYMLNTLLRDSDAMSMAHGLEIRVPLIDHRLAEKLFAMPGAWKVSRQTPKPLLVGALAGSLPEEIVHRRKRGFTFPFELWLRDELRDEVEESLRSVGRGPLAGALNLERVGKVWQDFLARRTSWSRPWSLYVLQRWCERNSVTV